MTNIQKSPKYPTNFIEILETHRHRRIAWSVSVPDCLAVVPAELSGHLHARYRR
jgi:hypothetical protein